MTLYILGAGQYGMAAKEIAQAVGIYEDILFLDDNSPLAVGKMSDMDKYLDAPAVIAIGNPEVRKRMFERLATPATLIHPCAMVMPSAKIGEGCIVEAGAVVCANAVVENGCILMSNCVVGHDARVEPFCQIKYGAVIQERTVVPANSKIDCNQVL